MAAMLDFLHNKFPGQDAQEPTRRKRPPRPPASPCPSDTSCATSCMSDLGAEAMGPEDFEFSHCVGRGSYASVYLARRRDSHELCALKAVQKHKIAQDADDLRHLRNEKEVMELLDSPFVVGARGTFQDGDYVYFAQDYMPGGDLYRRLRKAGGHLPLDQVQFFAAGTVLAIQHLHRRGCVHRDIKPENILLDADGYPRLTDFGFSRKLAKGEQLLSMFGTPEYVAPEVLLGRGHAHAADLWSLGVLIYELLVGSSPWCATGHGDYAQPPSTEDIYQRTTSGHVPFPLDMDPSARDLIAQLLQQDPRKRLGVAGWGPAGLRAHKFFKRIRWAALNARRVPAPYVPSVARRAPDSCPDAAHFSSLVCGDGSWEDRFGGIFDGFENTRRACSFSQKYINKRRACSFSQK